jgi:hypothetical protein
MDRAGSWHGERVSLDGTATHDFDLGDVAEVVALGSTDPGDWEGEGECCGVVKLRDGRYASWETTWHEDAYGGSADVSFSASPEVALRHLSERARESIPGTRDYTAAPRFDRLEDAVAHALQHGGAVSRQLS